MCTENNHNTIKTYGKSGDKNVYHLKNLKYKKWLVLFRKKGKVLYSKTFEDLNDAIKDSKEKRSIFQPKSPEGTLVKFNLAALIPKSKVNGPGERTTIWIAGCLRGCPGCFNPELWSFKEHNMISPEELAKQVLADGCNAITLSGGDPGDSPIPVLRFLRALHNDNGLLNPQLTGGIICFTGFTIEEVKEMPIFSLCLPYIDLLVEGRFIKALKTKNGIHGSSNQRFIWNELENRGKILIDESKVIWDQDFEVHSSNGQLEVTGFPELNSNARKYLEKVGIKIIK